MNSVQKNINNLLVAIEDPNSHLKDLYNICFKEVQKGSSLVLIMTSTKFDFSRLSPIKKMRVTKEQMKRLIVINYSTIDEVSKKLMDLHEWSLLPSLVVVDVSNMMSSTLVMKSYSLCAASFMDYLNAISMQMEKSFENGIGIPVINGIFIVKAGYDHFGSSHLQLLENLYFYKTNLLHGIDELQKHLKTDCQ